MSTFIVSYLSAYAYNKQFSQCDSKERTEKWNLIDGTIFHRYKEKTNLRYHLTIQYTGCSKKSVGPLMGW